MDVSGATILLHSEATTAGARDIVLPHQVTPTARPAATPAPPGQRALTPTAPPPAGRVPGAQVDPVSRIALDIGGSLCKIVHFAPVPARPNGNDAADGLTGGRLHFERFLTQDTDGWLGLLRKLVEENRRHGRTTVRRARALRRVGPTSAAC